MKFNYNSKYSEDEFARQLADQEKGMNNLTVDQYLKNRQRYINQGRSLEGNATQVAARKEALANKINELRNNGMSYSEAKNEANKWMKKQAALHNPDQIAGGEPANVSTLGDKGVNSSIGVQWKSRIDEVDSKIQDMAKNMSDAEKKSTKLNVNLTY